MSVEDELFFDTDFSDFNVSDTSDAESEVATAAAGPSKPKRFKEPAVPFLRQCPKCRKSYKTTRGYDSHLLMHNVRDAAARIVSPEEIQKEALKLADDVLAELSSKKPYGPLGQAFQDLCRETRILQNNPVWGDFVDMLMARILSCLPSKVILPSAMKSQFLDNLHVMLADRAFKSLLADQHSCLGLTVAEDVVYLFLGYFGRALGDKVILLVLRSLRPTERVAQIPQEPTVTLDLQKKVHFILGSAVKGLLVQANLWKDLSPKWARIMDCINSCFLEGADVPGPDSDIQEWTKSLDRGGLTKVGKLLHSFFTQAVLIAQKQVEVDRGDFIRQIYQSDELIFLWEEIIDGRLPSEESDWLMEWVSKKVFNTFGKGRANKEKNLAIHSQASVSTRQKLARK